MSIEMVRSPSETPNISNTDDFVGLRYSYGNQNGYVIGRGTEISNTVNGRNFTVNSGRLVLQGVECDIDANGVTITVDSVSTNRYYAVYLQVNLATNKAEVKNTYSTAGYPTVSDGDDLTANTNGTANLVLYTFTAQSGVISNVEKKVTAIDYTGSALVGYDSSKGTIEERLTTLGFKEGDAEIVDSNYITRLHYFKEGNLFILDLTIKIPVEISAAEKNDVAKTLVAKLPESLKFGDSSNISIAYGQSVNDMGMPGVAFATATAQYWIEGQNVYFSAETFQQTSGFGAFIPKQTKSQTLTILLSPHRTIKQRLSITV